MNQDEFNIRDAIREMLWIAVAWNDHNWSEGAIHDKCRAACEKIGIRNIGNANDFLQNIQITIDGKKEEKSK